MKIMNQIRPVRVIKHVQRKSAENPSKANTVAEQGPPQSRAVGVAGNSEPSERELKTVVAGWVREHRQRSEEYRRAFADLLKESGFRPRRAPKLA